MKAILGLDTATHTGWCVRSATGELSCGVWLLDFGPGRPHTSRFWNLWEQLDWMAEHHELGYVVAEKPVVYQGREGAARSCMGMLAILEMWCETRRIEFREVNIVTLKKFATGRGNAKKPEMVAAAKAKWPAMRIPDDNAADALFLVDYVCTPKKAAPVKAPAQRDMDF